MTTNADASIAPERAEKACLNLSQLMRRVLETSAATVIPCTQEMEVIQAYLKIEQERLGNVFVSCTG